MANDTGNGMSSWKLLEYNSRSFALAIPALERNTGFRVANQYQLCRLADTIEDAPFIDGSAWGEESVGPREEMMSKFLKIMKGEVQKDRNLDGLIKDMENKLILSPGESVLVENLGTVYDEFHGIDESRGFGEYVRGISLQCLDDMAKGMIDYQRNGIFDFENDLEGYCDAVASTVGRYLTQLIMNRHAQRRDGFELQNGVDEAEFMRLATNLGRFLQGINVIKNNYKDYEEGRSFWPQAILGLHRDISVLNDRGASKPAERKEALYKMIEWANRKREGVLRYISAIPEENAKDYRGFCAMCAVAGFETLDLLARPESCDRVFFGDEVKIPRPQMVQIGRDAIAGKYTNGALKKYAMVP